MHHSPKGKVVQPKSLTPNPVAPPARQTAPPPFQLKAESADNVDHSSGFDVRKEGKAQAAKIQKEIADIEKKFVELKLEWYRQRIFEIPDLEPRREDESEQEYKRRLVRTQEKAGAAKVIIFRLEGQGRALLARHEALKLDLASLNSGDPSKIKGVLEKHKGNFDSTEVVHVEKEGVKVDGLKASRNSDVRKETATKGDRTLETAKGRSASLDLGSSVFSTHDFSSTTFDNGGNTHSHTKIRNGKAYDFKNGTVTLSESDTELEAKGPDKETVYKNARGTDRKIGLNGYERRKWKEEIKDGQFISAEKKAFVKRGGGQLGAGASGKLKVGDTGKNEKRVDKGDEVKKFDPHAKDKSGEMEKGLELDGSAEGGVVFGPDAVGAYGSGEAGMTRKHGKGLSTGTKVGLGGKTLVSVREIPGSSPKKYAITVLINVNGSFGASAGKEFRNGAKANAQFTHSQSGTTKYEKVLTEAEAKAYLDSLSAAEKGKPNPKHPELGIIATGYKSGWDTAKKALKLRGEMTGDGIKGMGEGDSFSDERKMGNDYGFGGSAKGFGANVGWGSERSKTKGVKIVNGKAVLTVRVAETDRMSGGLSAGSGFATGGVDLGKSETHIHVVTVTLDPKAPNFDQLVAKVQAVSSYPEMVKLQRNHPEINVQFSHGKERSESVNTKAGLGPVTVNITDSASHSRMDNADGSTDLKGSNALGGGVSALGLTYGTSSNESLSAHVDKDGNARMDLSETNKKSDLGKSASSALDSLSKNPLSYLGELATGSAKPIKDSTNIPGTLMTNAEVDALINLASSPNKWSNAVSSPRLREDWMPMRIAIKNAGGDRRRIAEIMTEFVGKRGHGRREAFETALRIAGGKDNEGFRYEFPEGTTHLKPKYEKWVHTKPLAQVHALIKAGKQDEALRIAKAQLAEIQSLKGALATAKVNDKSRFGDMITFLSGPEAEVQKLVNRLENPNASEEELSEKDREKTYKRLLQNCKGYRHQFRQSLQKAAEMRSDGHLSLDETIANTHLVNQSGELMEQWEKDFAELKALATEHGFGGSAKEWAHYAPDNGWLNKMKSGEAPLGYSQEKEKAKDEAHSKAVEEAEYKDEIHKENDKITARVMANMPWNLEYKAKQQAKKQESEKQKGRHAVYQEWMPTLKSAKHQAAMAAGKCNGMNARGQAAQIKPAAKQKWGQAFGSLNKGNIATQQFQSMRINSPYHPNYMRQKATTAHSHYLKALDLFREGNRLQG